MLRIGFTVALLLSLAVNAFAGQILVAAAADLARLETPLNDLFKAKTGNTLRFVLGSSGMLSRQIENGAPYDALLSADIDYVKELAKTGHIIPDSVAVYAQGRLALWSKDGRVTSLKDLSRPGLLHIAIANPAHAPYGIAARQALEKLPNWKLIEPRLVLAENIRQTLQYAESGNAEVAVTAWSLVFDRGGVLLPTDLYNPILQGCGIVAGSSQVPLARSFLDLLTSRDGVAILERFGLFRPTR